MTGNATSSLTASARLSLIDTNLGPIRWPSVRGGGSSGTEVEKLFC